MLGRVSATSHRCAVSPILRRGHQGSDRWERARGFSGGQWNWIPDHPSHSHLWTEGDGGERCGRGRWREQACGVSEEATPVRSASAGAARRRGTPPGGRDAVLQTASRNRGFLPRRRQRRWQRAGRGEGAGEEHYPGCWATLGAAPRATTQPPARQLRGRAVRKEPCPQSPVTGARRGLQLRLHAAQRCVLLSLRHEERPGFLDGSDRLRPRAQSLFCCTCVRAVCLFLKQVGGGHWP